MCPHAVPLHMAAVTVPGGSDPPWTVRSESPSSAFDLRFLVGFTVRRIYASAVPLAARAKSTHYAIRAFTD